MEGVDLMARDPNSLNDLVQVAFHDVLGEPDGTHSIDCVWTTAHTCFTCSKNCCYKFVSTLCGLCIAVAWGCEFALITFEAVWCFTPALKAYSIIMGINQRFFGILISCCLAPICETCGLCLSNISMKKM
ncbi:caveolin-3-like [Mizuhopecten yessoensis]|uniref:Caveolin n=1 Tax=Mizuhopecten yessoensis TaxID=6573 RepID=A0A210PEW2_MIZYE|nr:caveolin-3-like [Mizuhopecten yessoensis]OWF35033.1 Caveolin-1 [Mizuhopecten yessoensis]